MAALSSAAVTVPSFAPSAPRRTRSSLIVRASLGKAAGAAAVAVAAPPCSRAAPWLRRCFSAPMAAYWSSSPTTSPSSPARPSPSRTTPATRTTSCSTRMPFPAALTSPRSRRRSSSTQPARPSPSPSPSPAPTASTASRTPELAWSARSPSTRIISIQCLIIIIILLHV
uniref:Uncharacterized protein n=1 Tax=Oryza brachyantha TaxID=4533 RepID=J3MAG4_ORYBR